MANVLTGDFDVVAQFSILAVDRILAAMHQTERFLHSISVRVDDNPHPGPIINWPTVVGAVDRFGDAVANQQQVGKPNPFPGASAANNAIYSRLGALVNPELLGGTIQIVPSHISGVAQLQIFPPTVLPPNAPGDNLTVRMNVMARFFPDAGTAPLAEFIRGELQISAPVNAIATGNVHVLDIDFKADEASITFTPSYPANLSAEDLAGISLCIQNGLRTSFLPSSVVLPSSIADVQLRTLTGALAVLLDFNDHPSNPSSVTNVFLTGNDGFVFAVGRDYLLNTLNSISSNIVSQPFSPIKFTVTLGVWNLGTTLHYEYPVTVTSASFDVSPPGHTGKIVLTLQANVGPEIHGHPPSGPFNVTVTAEFSLQPSGNTVLLGLGNVSVDPHSTAVDIIDFFTGNISGPVRDAILAVLPTSGADASVEQMFDTDANLANFLNTQFTPSDGSAPPDPQQVSLIYTSVDISADGIVLHGLVLLRLWPDPYVEFEQIPATTTGRVNSSVLEQGPAYSALKTWIPGGTIAEYDWSWQGQTTPFEVDTNKFVLQTGPTNLANTEAYVLTGYGPICLTIKGTRISNYGPTYDSVVASVCGVTRFPVNLGGIVTTVGPAQPTLAVTRPGPGGGIVVSGQTPVEIDRTRNAAPNLIVHFADSKSVSQLPVLIQSLTRSNRKDAPTAVIAVLAPDQLSKAPYVPGIMYAEDLDGAWQNALGVKSTKRPLTLIVGPKGTISWQGEGALELDKLSAALAKNLVKRGPVRISLPRVNVRIGQPAPNFLFEFAPGRELPLSKLFGQPLVLVFWKSSSRPSIDAVLNLQKTSAKAKGQTPVVMAINDGDPPELARGVAAESGTSATLVTDPKREIGLAYGVNIWPTIVSVNASGVITGIAYGYVPAQSGASPSSPAGSR